EALIRWQHPDGVVRYPDSFIHMAEQSGLIIPVGNWVINEACQQIREWNQTGSNPIGVHVNVSAEQFRGGGLAAYLSSALRDTGINPGLLSLELTESCLMTNAEESIGLMSEIKELGVSLSIDDFGTGYSSLSYLKRFPIDQIKIDRSFVSNIHNNDDGDKLIVMTLITLANGLSLDVVAEGVELMEQFSMLASFRCNKCQGFLFSKSMRGEDIPEFVSQWAGPPG
ncbi:MAG: EAL domain-containing protein, partial [Gammaproteobacteria bacterium]|nr:EAL domain-containing protein [Gammaproteobacteria bacterium]